jgi:Zn-dependent membrane protease YugP
MRGEVGVVRLDGLYNGILKDSQGSVAILCLTSHFAPRMTQTRLSHSTMREHATLFTAAAGVGHEAGHAAT